MLGAWKNRHKSNLVYTSGVGCGEYNEPHQRGTFKTIDAVRSSPHPTNVEINWFILSVPTRSQLNDFL